MVKCVNFESFFFCVIQFYSYWRMIWFLICILWFMVDDWRLTNKPLLRTIKRLEIRDTHTKKITSNQKTFFCRDEAQKKTSGLNKQFQKHELPYNLIIYTQIRLEYHWSIHTKWRMNYFSRVCCSVRWSNVELMCAVSCRMYESRWEL